MSAPSFFQNPAGARRCEMSDEPACRKTALHEAAHACVAVLIDRAALEYVSVEPLGDSLGRTVLSHRHAVDLLDHRQVEREIALRLAGCVAEIIDEPTALPTGCTEEVWRAALMAITIGHGRRGFMKLVGRTTRMLIAIWPTILVVAAELQRRRRLEGRVVCRLVAQGLQLGPYCRRVRRSKRP